MKAGSSENSLIEERCKCQVLSESLWSGGLPRESPRRRESDQ